jgi:hypothetical protein
VPILRLPEGDGPVLGVDEALTKYVLEDVLKITELMVLKIEVDELHRGGVMSP